MRRKLEFRGSSTCLFGDILLIALLGAITFGIYVPWGYVRLRKKILANTYYGDSSLQFDGSGGQLFGIMLKSFLLTAITLGIYGFLMYPAVLVLKWDAEHTIMPGGKRLEYRGSALDLFGQMIVVGLLSMITLGIYGFWGYVRIRSHIVGNMWVNDQPLQYTGTGGQYLGIGLVNLLLTAITAGIYALLGAAAVRELRWDAENTQVPELGGMGAVVGGGMQRPVEVHVTVNQ